MVSPIIFIILVLEAEGANSNNINAFYHYASRLADMLRVLPFHHRCAISSSVPASPYQ